MNSFPVAILSEQSAAAAPEPDWQRKWQRVLDFQFDSPDWELPFSAALAAEMEWEPEFVETAIVEYKKFIFLSSLYPNRLTPSIHVDTVWHLHILYTKLYHRFCEQSLGVPYVHHNPSTGGLAQEAAFKGCYAETLSRYREFFGEPPVAIWGPCD